MPVLGTPTLLLLVGACLTAGVVLLVMGLKTRTRGQDPHCAQCGYNLTGLASPICPECGTHCTSHTIVYGERYRQPSLAIAGLMLLLLGFGSVMPVLKILTTPPNRPSHIAVVHNVKMLISDQTALFKNGRIAYPVKPGARDGCHRMTSLQLHVRDKLRSLIQRKEANVSVRTAALIELAAADQFLQEQIMPAYEAALKSKAPEDAKALVPLMDQLDKHMDTLLQVLRGY